MIKRLFKYSLLLQGILFLCPTINAQQVIVSDAAEFNLAVAGTVDINADLINNSPNALLLGTFAFSGNTEHEIGGTAPIEFNNLSINNSAGIRLSTDIMVTGNLDLIAGTVNLLNSNVTIGSNASLSGSFSPNVMLIADGSGQLKREIAGSGTYLFPVGDTSNLTDYSPVSLTFSSGTFTNAVVGVNLKNEKHPENTSVNDYLNKYWTLSGSGLSDFSCTATFTYSNEDIVGSESNLWGAKWDGNQWTVLNQAAMNTFSGTINSFSDFTAGEKKVLSVEDELLPDDVKITVEGNNIIIRSDAVKLERAEIYNLSGQLIYSKDLSQNTVNELNFNARPNYYIVKVYSDKQTISKKIFKN
ncbi:MAG: T9SS type A sorting domain-containing protein [Bacteroidales bacterium]|nr:T9SS type A sorting domain-containing protein [Bacteroidales bacterium]